jgi:hypothetical protein
VLVDVNPRASHVTLGDKNVKLDIRASGHSSIRVLGPFLWVPRLTFTLISIPALDRIGCRTVLYDGEASITFNGEVILSGTLKDGLYHLDPVFIEQLGEDPESDTPGREPEGEYVMSSLARELEIEHSLQQIAKDVKGVHSAALATDKTPGTVVVGDTRARGSTETALHHYGYPGVNSALLCSRVWEQDEGGDETARHHYGYPGGNSVHQESIPSSMALMSLGPEDKAVGFSLLDVLHVRLGHMSEKNIKYSVRNHLFAGCDIQYDEIKDLKLHFCYTCQMGRMHAFSCPGSTKKQYKPLECIGVDYKGLQEVCGHTHAGARERRCC